MSEKMYVWRDAQDADYLHMGYVFSPAKGQPRIHITASFFCDAFADSFGSDTYHEVLNVLKAQSGAPVPVTLVLKLGHDKP